MAKTIGVISIKGGVGKTTLAAAIATDLANNYGKKVLLVDANYSAPNLGLHMDIVDPEKTIHHILDRKIKPKSAIQEKFGVDVIPGGYVYNKPLNYLKLKDKLKPLKNEYDFIVLDSSPSLNDELLSTMLASDSLFVVSTPDYPTLSCTLKAAKLAKQRGKPIAGIIVNKIRDPYFELNLSEIEEATEIPVVARIKDDKYAVRSTFTRIPLPIYKKKSALSLEVNRLCAALTQTPEKRNFFSKILPFDFRREQINRELLKESFYTGVFK